MYLCSQILLDSLWSLIVQIDSFESLNVTRPHYFCDFTQSTSVKSLWKRKLPIFLEKIRKCKCGFGHSFSYHINIFSFVCISASIGHFTDLVWHQVNVRELNLSLKYTFSQLKNSVIHGWCISSKLSSTASIVTVCRMRAAYVRMCEYTHHINVWLPGL